MKLSHSPTSRRVVVSPHYTCNELWRECDTGCRHRRLPMLTNWIYAVRLAMPCFFFISAVFAPVCSQGAQADAAGLCMAKVHAPPSAQKNVVASCAASLGEHVGLAVMHVPPAQFYVFGQKAEIMSAVEGLSCRVESCGSQLHVLLSLVCIAARLTCLHEARQRRQCPNGRGF